jgi:hypothetical protein
MAYHASYDRDLDEKPQRVGGIYGPVRGSEEWKQKSLRRVALLPPDVRGSKNSGNAALLMLDTSAFKPPTHQGGFYNYDHIGPGGLAEEPMIRDGANDVNALGRDNRKKAPPLPRATKRHTLCSLSACLSLLCCS